MSNSHKPLVGGVIMVIAVTVFSLVERMALHKPKADWSIEPWLRWLSGPNQTHSNPMVPQTGLADNPSGVPAEITGRVGYPLYH